MTGRNSGERIKNYATKGEGSFRKRAKLSGKRTEKGRAIFMLPFSVLFCVQKSECFYQFTWK